ncbi:MAG: fatty acid--CoA ligase [Alphaproteobacteria bacterium]
MTNRDFSTLADTIRYWAGERPQTPATIFEGRTTSYETFDRHASQIANGIIAAGVKPQSRVGYLGKNSDLYFELLFGTAKSNTVMVGINWRLAPPEVEYIANDAQVEMLFVDQEFFGLVDQIRDSLGTVKVFVAMSGRHDEWQDFQAWRDAQSDEDPMVPIASDDVCVQMYTSGTTGRPKGVQMTNFGFFSLRESESRAGEWARFEEDDVIMVPMPVFHIGGTGWGFYGFYNGVPVVILAQADPGLIIQAIQEHKVTKVFVVPAVLQFMLQHELSRNADFSHVRVVLYGASPIPEDTLVKAMETFKCPFVQMYGMTETNGTIVYLPFEEHKIGSERLKAAGKPYDVVEAKIVDTDGNEVPTREVGEIWLKTPSIMKGYWNLPEATAEATEGGWYHSGDAGYVDEEGYIYVFDRVKDMIVSGGENIYPAEVESALSRHEAVSDIAVIGVPSERWGEEVKAVIVKAGGSDVTEEEIIEFARTQIAGYKCPKSVDFVEELPRNPSGKLLKKDLREPYWEGVDRRVG